MQQKFWTQDWFIGVIVGAVFLLLSQVNWVRQWENDSYDLAMQTAARTPPTDISIIAIDQASLDKLGGLPWPRDVYARLLDKLTQAGAAFTSILAPFHETRQVPGNTYLEDVLHFYESSTLVNQFYCDKELLCASVTKEINALGQKLHALRDALDIDKTFAESIQRSGRFVMAMPVSSTQEESIAEVPDYVLNNRLNRISGQFGSQARQPQPLEASGIKAPLPLFGEAAASLGILPTVYGDTRSVPLVMQYQKEYYPTLPLVLAAKTLNLELQEIEVSLGEGIHLGATPIATDKQLRLRPFSYTKKTRSAFPSASFYDVYSNTVPATEYRDNIVLIGSTLEGIDAPVFQTARALSALLHQDIVLTPAWANAVKFLFFISAVLYISLLLPHLRALSAMGLTVLISLLIFALQTFMLTRQNIWLPLLLSIFTLLGGYLIFSLKQAWLYYRRQVGMDSETLASNRLEGLAYQGQGRLELAFEKFTQCPPDDLIMGLLYNLGLDFERKRQSKQAAAVYRYMSRHDPSYRDIEYRMARLQKPSKNRFHSSGSNLDDWLEDPHGLKPTLGRYQVERKIAKGSMGGDVYLGTDPKLDRMVALKTLALSEEFEGDELQEATTRFFREAAAAGRLTHPNIISVFDAGEEHDLAYISMEFFKGGNLLPYTRPDNLLPPQTAFQLIITAAEALDYAHRQGVIHRDIKPSNILYNPAANKLKLTDFGIARITDTKKTKTGVILGTPSYMSPEQLSGKLVDGQTDLFSLGVTLYQLLTGELPFIADSMAGLMFKIASEAHPDILQKCPHLKPCVKDIIDTLLQKDPTQRYADGSDTIQALRACLRTMEPLLEGFIPPPVPDLSQDESDNNYLPNANAEENNHGV